MKPLYLLSLALSVPAGLALVWYFSGLAPAPRFAAAMAPAVIIVLASLLDRPKPG